MPTPSEDLDVLALAEVELVPVVAPQHPLARFGRPVSRADLKKYLQPVLSDPLTRTDRSYGVVSTRIWRFVELARRIDFLLARA